MYIIGHRGDLLLLTYLVEDRVQEDSAASN